MKKYIHILIVSAGMLVLSTAVDAQCAVCTKTATQMGEKPAKGMNSGIVYLMMAPFAIVGVIAYRWWNNNKKLEQEEQAGSKHNP
jgi:hypothetical protein